MSRPAKVPAAADRILRRDRRALARAISQVENHDPAVDPVLRALYPRTGRARVVGLTGPLGVGKSSLVNSLLRHLRGEGRRVGVIGIDPSSPFSGGSVLGDRIRIDRAGDDEGLFFRSMASRGHSGGIAGATRDVVRLLDAFGMEIVLVETVGSGQVDVDIRRVASTNVVVLVPHLGDEVQSLKAGLFEIADVFCINKADLPGADGAARYLNELVQLGVRPGAWSPLVVQTSTVADQGIVELWKAVTAHETFLDAGSRREESERQRVRSEILELVRERVGERVEPLLASDPQVGRLLEDVVGRKVDPRTAADRVYAQLRRVL
ncbi:MAG TPA: methylmalonyl Co-A mutase-associated GTPase MeaB [Thermoplasmata archaeon]|nr:methylmalonyl Co-A mutase-associated GTPase MeaB [Thermoplasmata archaeon]